MFDLHDPNLGGSLGVQESKNCSLSFQVPFPHPPSHVLAGRESTASMRVCVFGEGEAEWEGVFLTYILTGQ